jgi:Common central domain of tyrosinase
MHNAVHAWVGGAMSTSASTNDPVFWLHHANVDRIWDMWQQKHGVDTYVPLDGYPANSANDVMMPFDQSGISVTPAMVADNRKFGVCFEESGPPSSQPTPGTGGSGGDTPSAGAGGGGPAMGGAGAVAPPPSDGPAPTFTRLYDGIMMDNCVPCHGAGIVAFQTKQEAYDSLVGADVVEYCPGEKRVVPGDPATSVLIQALKGEGCRLGRPMPPVGTRLSDADIERFSAWVRAGAKND